MLRRLPSLHRLYRFFPQTYRRFTTAPEAFYFEAIHSYFLPQAVFTARNLGLADKLKGAMSIEDLAKATGTVPERADRLMKYLAVHGVFERVSPGVYRHNDVSEVLKDENMNGRFAGIELNRLTVTKALDGWISALKGEVEIPFQKTFGNLTMWEFLALPANEPIKNVFDKTMVGLTLNRLQPIISAYPWQQHANANVVDVGGGLGHLLAELLQENPTFKGVVFDLPETISSSKQFWKHQHADKLDRIQFQPGSFLESIPAGGDIYILKYILHDWNDSDCMRILSKVVEGMRKTIQADASKQPTVLIMDQVYDFPPRMGSIADFDMMMFTLFSSKERSSEEFDRLITTAGLKVVEKIDTTSDMSIMCCQLAAK